MNSDVPVLPPDWNYEELGDLIEPGGISYGIVQPGQRDQSGVPIVRVNNVRDGRITTQDVLRVSAEVEASYSRTRLRGDEVLLSLVGSVGEVAVVPPEMAGWNVARAIAVIRPSEHVSSYWLKHWLRSPFARRLMHMWQTTTVQATLNLRDVRRLPVAMPPQLERCAITEALSTLDCKIESNVSTRRSLRALGCALFDEALAQSPAEAAIGDLAESLARGVAPKYTDPGVGVLVLNQKCIRDGWASTDAARWMEDVSVPDSKTARRGDIVVNSTGVGTLGRVARWVSSEPVAVDGHVTVVRFSGTYPRVVAGYGMLAAQPQIQSLGEGSTGQTELSRARLVRQPPIAS